MRILLVALIALPSLPQDRPKAPPRPSTLDLFKQVRKKYLDAKSVRIKGSCDTIQAEWTFKGRDRFRIDGEGCVPGSKDKTRKQFTWICDGVDFMSRDRLPDGQQMTMMGPAGEDPGRSLQCYFLGDGRLPLPEDPFWELDLSILKDGWDHELDGRTTWGITTEREDPDEEGALIVNSIFIDPETLTILKRTLSRNTSDGRWNKSLILSQQRYKETTFDAEIPDTTFAIPRK